MNKTEDRAHKWLVRKGYTGIRFRSNETPDFITDQDESFEVKRVNKGFACFGASQLSKLQGNTTVLFFTDAEGPVVVPASKVTDKDYMRDLNIRIQIAKAVAGAVAHVRFQNSDLAQVQQMADDLHISLSATVRMLTLSSVKRYGQEGIILPPWSTS